MKFSETKSRNVRQEMLEDTIRPVFLDKPLWFPELTRSHNLQRDFRCSNQSCSCVETKFKNQKNISKSGEGEMEKGK